MGIRTDPTDPTLHYLDYRPDGYKGKRVREIFRGSREAAEEYYRAVMQQPEQQKMPQVRTLRDLWPDYQRYIATNLATSTCEDITRSWMVHLAAAFGGLRPKYLTTALIEQYKQDRRATGVKPRTINKELLYLSGMINWAAKMGHCAPLPFRIQGFPSRMTKAPTPRPLLPDQVDALLAAARPAVRLPLLLMADAGLRASEALTLTRQQVDIERRLLYIKGKGSKERIVPIATSRLLAALEEAVVTSTTYLTANPRTGQPYASLKKGLAAAAKRAGIEQHVYQHLLRHTFGTTATAAGVAQGALQAMLGHSSPSTTGIYQHLAATQLQAQAAKFGDMINRSACPDGHVDKEGNSAE